MKNRIFSLLLAIILICLPGCSAPSGENGTQPSNTTAPATEPTTVPTTEPITEPTTVPTTEPTTAPTNPVNVPEDAVAQEDGTYTLEEYVDSYGKVFEADDPKVDFRQVSTYDPQGNLIGLDRFYAQSDVLRYAKRWIYDEDNILVEYTRELRSENGDFLELLCEIYNEAGAVLTQTTSDLEGNVIALTSYSYYESGVMMEEVSSTGAGILTGKISYTEDGKKASETDYYEDGTPRTIQEFDENSNHILTKSFNPAGTLVGIYYFMDGYDLIETFNSDGTLKSREEHYSNGSILREEYYPNGNVKEISKRTSARVQTYYETRWENGNIRERITFYDNGQNKTRETYHESGALSSHQDYLENGRPAYFIAYLEDGTKLNETLYNEEGIPTMGYFYHPEDGTSDYVYFDEDGRPIPEPN